MRFDKLKELMQMNFEDFFQNQIDDFNKRKVVRNFLDRSYCIYRNFRSLHPLPSEGCPFDQDDLEFVSLVVPACKIGDTPEEYVIQEIQYFFNRKPSEFCTMNFYLDDDLEFMHPNSEKLKPYWKRWNYKEVLSVPEIIPCD